MSVGLSELVEPRLIFPELSASDGGLALRELAERVVEEGVLQDADDLFDLLHEREKLGSTGIGRGVAVPHCKVKGLRKVLLAVGLAPAGVDFAAVDGEPVRVFFVVLSPIETPAAHLQCLAAISKWVQGPGHLERLFLATEPEQILRLLKED